MKGELYLELGEQRVCISKEWNRWIFVDQDGGSNLCFVLNSGLC